MIRLAHALFFLLLTAALGSCAGGGTREYELRGQVMAVDTDGRKLTIRHDDIPGFMPGMTMPFPVRTPQLLEGRQPGDLVRATLVVREEEAWLTRVERVGHVPLEPAGAPPGGAAPLAGPGDEAPDAVLIGEDGQPLRLSDLRGRVVAVTFIYTRCPVPNFCPLMDRHFAAAQRELAADPRLRDRAQLLSVSFDPEVDTPAVLAAHARRVGADPDRWRFVTGDRANLDPFAAAFGVTIIREDSDMEIVHNLRTAVLDPRGRIVKIFSGNEWTPTELLQVMRAAGA